jgi:hypothetical protein
MALERILFVINIRALASQSGLLILKTFRGSINSKQNGSPFIDTRWEFDALWLVRRWNF